MKWFMRSIQSLTREEYDRCLSLMEPGRRQAVLAMQHTDAQRRTVLGEWMTKCAIQEYTGLPLADIRLARDERGKPYAKELPLHFNISHSGEWVVCALSERPVGIDIERIRPVHPRLSQRICTAEDLAYLEDAPTPDRRQERLFRLWTAKEAYFKWKGTGLQELRQISLADILPRCQQKVTGEYVISIVE